MSIQTSMLTTPAVAYAGMVSQDTPGFRDIISKISAASIPNGVFVTQGTADDQCELPNAAGDITPGGPGLGVAIFDPTVPTNWPPGTTVPYPSGQAVPIMRRGRVYVVVEEAVSKGDDVYVRYAAGVGGTQLGAFRSSDPGSEAAQLEGAKYATSAGAAGLALLELNLAPYAT